MQGQHGAHEAKDVLLNHVYGRLIGRVQRHTGQITKSGWLFRLGELCNLLESLEKLLQSEQKSKIQVP
jgi:hypothetical protein